MDVHFYLPLMREWLHEEYGPNNSYPHISFDEMVCQQVQSVCWKGSECNGKTAVFQLWLKSLDTIICISSNDQE